MFLSVGKYFILFTCVATWWNTVFYQSAGPTLLKEINKLQNTVIWLTDMTIYVFLITIK